MIQNDLPNSIQYPEFIRCSLGPAGPRLHLTKNLINGKYGLSGRLHKINKIPSKKTSLLNEFIGSLPYTIFKEVLLIPDNTNSIMYVDYLIEDYGIIIELDDTTHEIGDRPYGDFLRDNYTSSLGFVTLRVDTYRNNFVNCKKIISEFILSNVYRSIVTVDYNKNNKSNRTLTRKEAIYEVRKKYPSLDNYIVSECNRNHLTISNRLIARLCNLDRGKIKSFINYISDIYGISITLTKVTKIEVDELINSNSDLGIKIRKLNELSNGMIFNRVYDSIYINRRKFREEFDLHGGNINNSIRKLTKACETYFNIKLNIS